MAAGLATLAGREAVRVARLSQALGGGAGLLVALWIATAASSAFAGWLGAGLGQQLPGAGKTMFVAIALALGAAELVVLRAGRTPREPTRSFGAILVVLLAAQLTDAARFLILALAGASTAWWLVAAGGAIGAGIALTAAWAMEDEWEKRLPLGALRWSAASLMLLAAVFIALTARGLLG